MLRSDHVQLQLYFRGVFKNVKPPHRLIDQDDDERCETGPNLTDHDDDLPCKTGPNLTFHEGDNPAKLV